MKKYKDFDAAWAEMKHETIPFKAFGKTYHIRKSIPATVVLAMRRMSDGATLSAEFVLDAAEKIFGRETLDEIAAHDGFGVEELNEMIKWAFAAINGTEEPEPQEITEDDLAAGATERKN